MPAAACKLIPAEKAATASNKARDLVLAIDFFLVGSTKRIRQAIEFPRASTVVSGAVIAAMCAAKVSSGLEASERAHAKSGFGARHRIPAATASPTAEKREVLRAAFLVFLSY